MSFSSGYLADPSLTGSGERYTPKSDVILSAVTFEDQLKVGRFAKVDAGSIDNMDGSATPVIAGIVIRSTATPIEDGGVIDSNLYDQIAYGRSGLFTVDAKAGETPSEFDAVYVSNAGNADDGKATVTNTDLASRAEYIQTITTDVWLVRLY